VASHIEQLGKTPDAGGCTRKSYVYGAISEEGLDRVIVKYEDDECTGHVFHGPRSRTDAVHEPHDSAVTIDNEFVGNRLSVD